MALLIDSVFLVTATDIEANGQSGAQVVETLLGLSGKTPGAKRLELSATLTVPVSGPEFDAFAATANGTYHEIQIPLGPKTLISQGWINDCSVKGSTGGSTAYSFNFIGELNPPD